MNGVQSALQALTVNAPDLPKQMAVQITSDSNLEICEEPITNRNNKNKENRLGTLESLISRTINGTKEIARKKKPVVLRNENQRSSPAKKKIISSGHEFDEAYFVTSGEVCATRSDKTFFLGPGAVLGLAEGMVGIPSRYTLMAHTALQVKIIAFHKVDNIVHQLPPEMKSILVSLIKRNLTVK
jgi:mannose-6-phosphate isomerase-like protein (cupin superfamily)